MNLLTTIKYGANFNFSMFLYKSKKIKNVDYFE